MFCDVPLTHASFDRVLHGLVGVGQRPVMRLVRWKWTSVSAGLTLMLRPTLTVFASVTLIGDSGNDSVDFERDMGGLNDDFSSVAMD